MLVLGTAGAALSTFSMLLMNLRTYRNFGSGPSPILLLGNVGAFGTQVAMTLFFFLVLRFLLFLVPLLLDMREWMLSPEEAAKDDAEGTPAV